MSVANSTDQESRSGDTVAVVPIVFVLLPVAIALIATVGSLWLSMRMNLKACPLCFYQRTFAMSVVGVLGIGLLTGTRYRNVLNVLALPLAIGGCGVAAFHVYLELSGKLECPLGVIGIGTAPQQSLAIFLMLLAFVGLGAIRSGNVGGPRMSVLLAAVALGVMFVVGAVNSTPPMPGPPSQPYPGAPEICRPPFHAAQ